jgi:hypothetical protein
MWWQGMSGVKFWRHALQLVARTNHSETWPNGIIEPLNVAIDIPSYRTWHGIEKCPGDGGRRRPVRQ